MINVIYDRTQDDVDSTERIINRYKENLYLTEEEINSLKTGSLKGGYTYTDLNRVESAIKFLSDELSLNLVCKTDWNTKDFFFDNDLTRWIDNINKLKVAIHVNGLIDYIPNTPSNFKSFENANDIERILYLLDVYKDSIFEGVHRLAFKLGMKSLGIREV